MNFFQAQEAAQTRSRRLFFLFFLAILGTILAVHALVSVGFYWADVKRAIEPIAFGPYFLDLQQFGFVAAATTALIVLASFYRMATLSKGGGAVAEMMGGREVFPGSKDPMEKTYFNVVEEMAIASGVPVPRIFVLPGQSGINAFAAGLTYSDAAVAVTDGALATLSRDELAGVIAHEFSHIFHGDMQINHRITGLLFGIWALGILGMYLLRSSVWSRRSRNSGGLVAAGIGLWLIGGIGLLMGRLIQASISRQREYLADASAVQYTRNPLGLAGALKKIFLQSKGANINNRKADECAHMFFSDIHGLRAFAFMATHPPLKERIRRLEPSFDPGQLSQMGGASTPLSATHVSASELTGQGSFEIGIDDVGGLPQASMALAHDMFKEAEQNHMLECLHEPAGARAAVYAMLLTDDENQADVSDRISAADPQSHVLLSKVQVNKVQRLAMLDMAMVGLRQMDRPTYEMFSGLLLEIAYADDHVSMFEYVLVKLIQKHLKPTFQAPRVLAIRHRKLKDVAEDAWRVMVVVANQSSDAESAFLAARACHEETFAQSRDALTREVGIKELDQSLGVLTRSTPAIKAQIMELAWAVAHADRQLDPAEEEFIRCLGDMLDCPVPLNHA